MFRSRALMLFVLWTAACSGMSPNDAAVMPESSVSTDSNADSTSAPEAGEAGETVDASSEASMGDVAVNDSGVDGGTSNPDAGMMTPTCANESESPLRNGSGGFSCVSVGASTTAATSDWPATTDLPTPLVYVRAGAAMGGDGSSMDRAFATIEEGVAALPGMGGSVVVARGTYMLSAAVSLRGNVTLAGAGPTSGTVLVAARGASGIAVEAGARARISGLLVRYGTRSAINDTTHVAMRLRMGSNATLRDVAIEDAHTGLFAQGATLEATALTVRRSAQSGVLLVGGAQAHLRSFVVRDGQQIAVAINDTTRAHFTEGLIANHGAHGLSFVGSGAPMGGAASCSEAGPVGNGALDCVTRVAINDTTYTGLYASGTRTVEGRLLQIGNTRTASGANGGGDGVFLTGGARLRLDADMTGTGAARRGVASLIVGNARTGFLVDGQSAAGASSLMARGTTVASNGGPGLFLQNTAQTEGFSQGRFEANTAVGIACAPGSVVMAINDTTITDTRMGQLRVSTSTGQLELSELGDGLMLSGQAMLLADSEISRNSRYGLAVAGNVQGAAMRNSGSNNRFGVAIGSPNFNADMQTLAIGGRETPPATPPAPIAPITPVMP